MIYAFHFNTILTGFYRKFGFLPRIFVTAVKQTSTLLKHKHSSLVKISRISLYTYIHLFSVNGAYIHFSVPYIKSQRLCCFQKNFGKDFIMFKTLLVYACMYNMTSLKCRNLVNENMKSREHMIRTSTSHHQESQEEEAEVQ